MFRSSLLLLALLMNTQPAKAEPIRLLCIGSGWLYEGNVPAFSIPEENLLIDLDRRKLSGFGIPLSIFDISNATDTTIWFGAFFTVGDKREMRQAKGSVSRTTGRARLWWFRVAEPNKFLGLIELNCAPSTKLF